MFEAVLDGVNGRRDAAFDEPLAERLGELVELGAGDLATLKRETPAPAGLRR